MRFTLALSVLATLSLAALASAQAPVAQPPPPPPAVAVGQPAPDFTLAYLAPVADGKVEPRQVKLSDFKGKQNVVLAFFPAAFSPG